ncbi:MAG: phospholipase D-like domain-containing protein [Cyanobacteria bacterium P01_F01_bin.150]
MAKLPTVATEYGLLAGAIGACTWKFPAFISLLLFAGYVSVALRNRFQLERSLSRQLHSSHGKVQEILSLHQGRVEDKLQAIHATSLQSEKNICLQLQAALSTPIYEVVEDKAESRAKLLHALTVAQERLVIVCPWVSSSGLDQEVEAKLNTLLERGVRISFGIGYLPDLHCLKFLENQLVFCGSQSDTWKYNGLSVINRLVAEFEHCDCKVLGTHEKYVVCDDSFVMLGSHNFLTSSSGNHDRDVGIFTTDSDIVQSLTHRFDVALDRTDTLPKTPKKRVPAPIKRSNKLQQPVVASSVA